MIFAVHSSLWITDSTIYIFRIYSKDIDALSALIEDARQLYLKVSQPNVIIRSADKVWLSVLPVLCLSAQRWLNFQAGYDDSQTWLKSKAKRRRSLNSIFLQEGVVQSILEDAREFLDSEEWYTLAGIPYRRGYLLHGPPGTGKSAYFVFPSFSGFSNKYTICRFDNIWYRELSSRIFSFH